MTRFPKWSRNVKIQSQRSLSTRYQLYYICFNGLCKPIEKYIYVSKKHPFTSYPATKQQKHSKFGIKDMREKPVDLFFMCGTGVNFSSRNNFAKLSLLCKSFRSCRNYNPLFKDASLQELLPLNNYLLPTVLAVLYICEHNRVIRCNTYTDPLPPTRQGSLLELMTFSYTYINNNIPLTQLHNILMFYNICLSMIT